MSKKSKVTKAPAKETEAQVKQTSDSPGWLRRGFPKKADADNLPATTSAAPNPWSAYGASASNTVYPFLKFNKGEFLAGRDAVEIAIGTRMAVDMDSLEIGWVKWLNLQKVDQLLGRIAEGFKACKRSELDDPDEESWPLDENGERKDPWQFTNQIAMATVDDGAVYTFTTSSRGGLNAIGLLCRTYGEVREQHPNEWPVVELGVGSYQHSNRAYGRVKYPIFNLVGWVPKDAKKAAA
jgi:hypothetical protein